MQQFSRPKTISVLDKSLDLEKFSKRNYSWFSLSSWRSEFSSLVLLSNFKILRKHFSFSSRFTRFLYWTSLSPLDFQDFVEQFLFLLSIFNILKNNFSFSSRFSRFSRTLSLSPLDFQDLNKSFSPLDIQDFVPCFSSKLGLRCLSLTFVFHLRRNILEEKMKSSS